MSSGNIQLNVSRGYVPRTSDDLIMIKPEGESVVGDCCCNNYVSAGVPDSVSATEVHSISNN